MSFPGQFYEGQEGQEALTEQGQAVLERLEAGQGDNHVPNGNVESEYGICSKMSYTRSQLFKASLV